MDLDAAAGCRGKGSRRRGLALIMSPLLAAVAMAIASPAQAHEYVGKAWGLNESGQLGDGTTAGPGKCEGQFACSTTPVAVRGLTQVTAVAGGSGHSLALLENGTIMAWGENGQGQLGNGTTTSSDVPVAASGLKEVTAVAAGRFFSLALLSNGTVMAWGENCCGQLGNGTTTSSDVPVAVSGLSGIVDIVAGLEDGLALLGNGTVMAWGENGQGQLGNGTTTSSDVPVAVKELKEVTAISGGGEHNLALLKNGTVMAWGQNAQGELGNGTTTSSDVPVAVNKLSEVTAISAGSGHSLALLKNGTAMAWGTNSSGELGDGSSSGPETCGKAPTGVACSKTPVAVSALSGVSAISSANGSHSLALLSDGTVATWGANSFGQLGDGTSVGPEGCGAAFGTCSTTPVAVCAEGMELPCPSGPFLRNVEGIGAGKRHSLAFVAAPPTVTAISPHEGPKAGGTTVTITGTELDEATEVTFGSTEAKSVKVNSEGTELTAISPPGTGTVDVTVRTLVGTSATSSADQFHYAPPKVKKLSPKNGPASGGTTVTITGEHFTGATAAKFGANSATEVKVKSDSTITCVSPASTAKAVFVTVTTPSGTSAISGKGIRDRFKYKLS